MLGGEAAQRLLERAERRRHAANELVLEEGSESRAVFIIRAGWVRIEKRHLGASVAVNELGPGEIFGEISFLEQSVASASVVAGDDVELDVLNATDIDELVESDPLLGRHFYRALALTLAGRLRYRTEEAVTTPFSWG